ncbi:3-hydroxyacyl-CoA dehydrogenase NAD-binding domain-containing protein [Rhizobium sp. 1AS11]|uniref:3-hydroxyacyl-CoA dehydrogenase NAD-binding domain-containing protein n=1 Tax=Rhizobium acaciae TaxID=2989736 RepID=UPI0022226B4E|nr:3-hydroxyacyl-CoA dehydrogenase NAD-binding domain-containing protein [Rhizobium acaciae]MCW1410671.1 3-hydroxyacyl-CoA dehydrogenase NAD-binding domain-containing protein [Rhizobium acaciae]MCW1743028.1 3-hydroxyacyl-CoA dehydrogenase NAD-binding domain-containing protein [Rhizobium acaciae]
MTEFKTTAVLGAGVIGASWTALFLASGRDVALYDMSPNAEKTVREYVERAWPTLDELGLVNGGSPDRVRFCRSAPEAVEGAMFIQENVPERLEIKNALYEEIERELEREAVIATSTSGLTLSEMQTAWKNPSRFVLGHPFNPPHLIPLVEVMGNGRTDPSAIEAAERFYSALGKVTIRLSREVPGHVANRLQAAVWREAIYLVKTGVASVEDVDKAMWAGPGLRWAAMGPTMLFHLGGGEGGLAAFCERLGESFDRWWDDLGILHLDAVTSRMLVSGVEDEANGQTLTELAERRDALIASIQKALIPYRKDQ